MRFESYETKSGKKKLLPFVMKGQLWYEPLNLVNYFVISLCICFKNNIIHASEHVFYSFQQNHSTLIFSNSAAYFTFDLSTGCSFLPVYFFSVQLGASFFWKKAFSLRFCSLPACQFLISEYPFPVYIHFLFQFFSWNLAAYHTTYMW